MTVYSHRWLRTSLLLLPLLLWGCASQPAAPDAAGAEPDTTPEEPSQAQQNTAAAIADFRSNDTSDRPEPPAVPNALNDMVLDDSNNQRRSHRFDVAADGVALSQFLQDLADVARTNILPEGRLSGSVSLRLRDVTVEDVMLALQDQLGIGFENTGYGYRVTSDQIQTRMFRINYLDIQRTGSSATGVSSGQIGSESGQASQINTANSTDFWSTIESTLQLMMGSGGGRQLVVNPQTGLIVVRANPRELKTISEFLFEAELALQQQVIIEARVLEVRLTESFESGIDWRVLGESGGLSASAGVSGNPFATPSQNNLDGEFGFSLNLSNFNTVIRALRTQGEVEVLSSPRISTVNNQKAVIKVGSQDQFVTVSSVASETSDGDTEVIPTFSLQPYFSGISLDVTPQISENEDIILHVHPSVIQVTPAVRSFTVSGESYNLPVASSTVRETDSVVRAGDGQVVIIGGLLQNSVTRQNSSLPGNQSGLLGWLFGQERDLEERSELIILLRPIIADPAAMQEQLDNTSTRLLQP